jgi:dynein light chain LC8-type
MEDRRTRELLERHVKNADMAEEMQLDAIRIAQAAQEVYLVEKDIASFIRREFENKYNPTWHCIVGRNFGSFITHETKHFIYFYTGQVAILLFKAG